MKAPRLQEKYLAEVQDIAGLCQRAVTSLTVDALEVSSFDAVFLANTAWALAAAGKSDERLFALLARASERWPLDRYQGGLL